MNLLGLGIPGIDVPSEDEDQDEEEKEGLKSPASYSALLALDLTSTKKKKKNTTLDSLFSPKDYSSSGGKNEESKKKADVLYENEKHFAEGLDDLDSENSDFSFPNEDPLANNLGLIDIDAIASGSLLDTIMLPDNSDSSPGSVGMGSPPSYHHILNEFASPVSSPRGPKKLFDENAVRHAKDEISLTCTKPEIPSRIPESEAEEYAEEIEFLKMKNQELENHVTELQVENEEMSYVLSEHVNTFQEFGTSPEEVIDLKAKLVKYEIEIENYKNQMKDFENKVQECEKLKDQISKTQDRTTNLEKEMKLEKESGTNTIADLKDKLRALELENKQLRNQERSFSNNITDHDGSDLPYDISELLENEVGDDMGLLDLASSEPAIHKSSWSSEEEGFQDKTEGEFQSISRTDLYGVDYPEQITHKGDGDAIDYSLAEDYISTFE